MQLDADEDGTPLNGNFAAAANQQQQQAQSDQLLSEGHGEEHPAAGNGPEAEHGGIAESQDTLASSTGGEEGHAGMSSDPEHGEGSA